MKTLLFILSLLAILPAQAEVYRGETIARERKVFSIGYKVVELLTNEEKDEDGGNLSQAELDRLSYYFHYYELTVEELEAGRDEFYEMGRAQKLSVPKMVEGLGILTHFVEIGKKMMEHEAGGSLRCKYAYGGDLKRELERDREKELAALEAARLERQAEDPNAAEWDQILGDANAKEAAPKKATIFGLCWDRERYRD